MLRNPPDELTSALAAEFEIHPTIARILALRDVDDMEAASRFLNPSLETMHDPFSMAGMERAVREILRALDRGGRIVIHGDYDVDGVCSTSVLYSFLNTLGADVDYVIPRRDDEGYGFTVGTVEDLAEEGCELLITVDCGISSVDEIALARRQDVRVVVVDHHSIPQDLPPADAIVDPLQEACEFPFEKLAAVGVTFNLVVALRKELRERGVFRHVPEPDLRKFLDLVALGTIADVMPLVDENRVFTHFGLEVLARRKRAGISALLERGGSRDGRVHTQTVSYGLAPRLNAAGRVADASICVELLTTRDYGRALELAEQLEGHNEKRRADERAILEEVLPAARRQVDDGRNVLLLAARGWPRGVLGIVANRLTETFHRPAILAGIDADGARGSARSIDGVDILEVLRRNDELLLTYGGHASAAGLAFEPDILDRLHDALDASAAQMFDSAVGEPGLEVDAVVELAKLDDAFLDGLLRLEPFGEGNPRPILVARSLESERARIVGENHLRARFTDGQTAIDGIAFSKGSLLPMLEEPVHVAFMPHLTRYRGRARLEMHIEDIRPAYDPVPDSVLN